MNPDIYDFLIIGASADGVECAIKLADLSKENELKIGLVSENFKHFDFGHSSLISKDLFCVPGKVIFSGYNHGLISFDLADGQRLFTKKAIIATHTKPDTALFGENSGIHYNVMDLDYKRLRKAVALVGNGAEVFQTAIKLAKHTDFVYICCPEINFNISAAKQKKLLEIKNIVVLPKCDAAMITSNTIFEDRDFKKLLLFLDNDNILSVEDVVFVDKVLPDIPDFCNGFIEKTDDNKILVNEHFETTKIPNVFAISKCASRNSKNDVEQLLTYLKQINGWR